MLDPPDQGQRNECKALGVGSHGPQSVLPGLPPGFCRWPAQAASAAGPAGFIGSEKTVEQMRQHVFIHPRSVIAETEHQS